MRKYRFDDDVLKSMEAMPLPFAVYQYVDKRVYTLLLSDGLLKLFDYDSREAALQMTESDRYQLVHPDDIARISEASYRFSTTGAEYRVVYRTKTAKRKDYIIIRARGEHVLTPTGERLAYVWYEDEGRYSELAPDVGVDLNKTYGQLLDQVSANRGEHYDYLTGMPNMAHFFELADAGIRRMFQEGVQPVLLFMDMSGMKAFNVKYGFAEGDKLIREVGALLKRCFGNQNSGHFAQDHFGVFADSEGLEDRLGTLFAEIKTVNGGKNLPLRVGIYRLPSEEKLEIGACCDLAKMACGKCARGQDSHFRYFDEGMLQEQEKRQYIVDNIDLAIRENWIKVYYQPIVRAVNGQVCDEEALARWIDPVKGFLSPADFIPALEESRLIYKLDLFMLEQVLRRMHKQEEMGLYVVPVSINLSRADFESCDIVEEIRRRVADDGADPSLITIEITESIVGSDFEFIQTQVARFRELGFQVWMDDFGSGYSSLDVLQNIHFDVIKFDMRFMQQFHNREESKIILTELVKMAIGLGVQTVCEGVEDVKQFEFLREIGCTKIQGYYYCKPIPEEEVFRRYQTGTQIGFENPEESGYFEMLGKANLYDMAVLADETDESLHRYYDTLPMAIIEVRGERLQYVRCNTSYRIFLKRMFASQTTSKHLYGPNAFKRSSSAFVEAVLRCSQDGNRAVIDEKMGDNTTIHSFIRRLAVNPVTGTVAIAVAVLAIVENNDDGTTYEHIARALARDYVNLYYVDLETDEFVEYSSDVSREDLAVERHGDDFFNASRKDAQLLLYGDDVDYFRQAFTKENIVRAMREEGHFTLTYRLLMDGKATYVNMKAMPMQRDARHIIIGVSNVDAQMQQKEALARIQAEQISYARIAALSGDFICIYTVDPSTDRYTEYSVSRDYEGLGLAKQGEDFFNASKRDSIRALYEEDIPHFLATFNKENVMQEIRRNGLYELKYRLNMNGVPTWVMLKAAMMEEKDGAILVVGINNIDARVRYEQEIERKLFDARSRINLDGLTGVKNRSAYENMSDALTRQIEEGQPVKYAIALCSIAGLQQVNDICGRAAGDKLIRDTCAIVCNVFKHSPVFRVAGDEFAAICQGHDYEHVDELVAEVAKSNARQDLGEDASIKCGMAKYTGSGSVAAVFARADAMCRGER